MYQRSGRGEHPAHRLPEDLGLRPREEFLLYFLMWHAASGVNLPPLAEVARAFGYPSSNAVSVALAGIRKRKWVRLETQSVIVADHRLRVLRAEILAEGS